MNRFSQSSSVTPSPDDLMRRLRVAEVVAAISTRFLNVPSEQLASRFEALVAAALEEVGTLEEVSRAFLYLPAPGTEPDDLILDNTNEWCAEGHIPNRNEFQRHDLRRAYPHTYEKICGGQPWAVRDLEEISLPEGRAEHDLLSRLGIRACLLIPCMRDGRLGGYIGFSSAEARFWRPEEIALLRITGEIFLSEHQRMLTHQRLETAVEREREFNRLRRGFVSLVSHEFRTPLAVLLSSAQTLEDFDESPALTPSERRASLQRIIRATRRMEALLNSIPLLDSLQSGSVVFQPRPLNLPAVCRHAVADAEKRLSRPGFIRLIPPPQGLETMPGDLSLLREILRHLLDNAIKYVPAECPQAELEILQTDATVAIRLRDQGPGIPEGQIASMLQPFHRGGNSTPHAGIGVGLSIAEGFSRAHGGSLELVSPPPGFPSGLQVTVTLPLLPTPLAPLPPLAPASSGPPLETTGGEMRQEMARQKSGLG